MNRRHSWYPHPFEMWLVSKVTAEKPRQTKSDPTKAKLLIIHAFSFLMSLGTLCPNIVDRNCIKLLPFIVMRKKHK